MKTINIKAYYKRKKDILKFLSQNQKHYGPEEFKGIKFLISTDTILEIDNSIMPAQISQLLSKFRVTNPDSDEYLHMLKLLKNYSFLTGNCCEIAAGIYPRLSELTAPVLKSKKGSLTIYEPQIMIPKIKNATIRREPFTKNTNIDSIDTLYALYPCNATIAMTEKAFEEDKNLLLAFCPCDHSTKEYPKWIGKYWAEDFCMNIREKYGKEAEIIKWPTSIGLELPILVRQSTKHKEKIMKKLHK